MNLLTADQVLAGLYAWLGDNRWFLAETIDDADMTAEVAAREGLLMLARGDITAYRQLPVGIKALAMRLTMDLFAKLIGPMAKASWPVTLVDSSPKALQAAAWRAVELELLRHQPPKPMQH